MTDHDDKCPECDEDEDDCTCPADCPNCAATGIGQYGDPDTSRCVTCRGLGTLTRRRRYRYD